MKRERTMCNEQTRFEPLEDRRMFAGGGLDTTFGVGGTAKPNLGFAAVDMAVQPDGKTLALGQLNKEWVVARLDVNGALDRSFGGGDGMASVRFDKDPSPERIAIQPGGKIVMAGVRGKGNIVTEITGADEMVLARLNTNGSPDPTFGTGGKRAVFGGNKFNLGALALGVQPDGKLILAHSVEDVHPIPRMEIEADFFVGRLNADGSVDRTFGQRPLVTSNVRSGFVKTDMDGLDIPSAIAIAPDGKIVVGGTKRGNFDIRVGDDSDEFGPHQFLVARYNADGTLDKTFDGNGKLATNMAGNQVDDFDELTSIVVQRDGKIVAGGLSRGQFALVRYNLKGSIDTTFAGGRVFTNLSGGQDIVNSLFLDPRGNITAVGTVDARPAGPQIGKRLSAVQYLPNGLLDRSFGTSGIAKFETGTIVGSGAARAPGGKIVISGTQGSQTSFVRFAQATPIVEVRDLLNDRTAEGSNQPAAILIRRDFAYDFPTRVFLDVSGSATEGVDYTSPALRRTAAIRTPNTNGGRGSLVPVQLQGFKYFIDIPAGADFVVAEVFAKADNLHEGEENIHWAPVADVSYHLGAGNAGHVLIRDVLA